VTNFNILHLKDRMGYAILHTNQFRILIGWDTLQIILLLLHGLLAYACPKAT